MDSPHRVVVGLMLVILACQVDCQQQTTSLTVDIHDMVVIISESESFTIKLE